GRVKFFRANYTFSGCGESSDSILRFRLCRVALRRI
ncbi:hypothetical protein LTSEMIS_4686, partial [Salmonella enterica subsp. enterica serovar Mississippi str. A4-633]